MEQKTYDWVRTLICILLVVSLGLLSINQYMGFRYKVLFLGSPCQLCEKLNPQVKDCFVTKTIVNTGTPIDYDYNLSQLGLFITPNK